MQDLSQIAVADIFASLKQTAAATPMATIGAVNYDEIFLLPGDMRDDGASHVSKKKLLAGGHAANCASALAGLGCPTSVIGAVGRDSYGRWLIEDLKATGIDTSHVQRVHAETGRAIIPVFRDGHFMILERGANDLCQIPAPEALAAFEAFAVFDPSVSTLEKLIAAVESMRTKPDIYWTPGGHYASHAIVPSLLPHLRAVFLNVTEAEDFKRAHGKSIAQEDQVCIIETLGAAGAALRCGAEKAASPGFLTDCVDPTGAGDHFAACFILADQAGLDWADCLRLANLGGMVAVETVGARAKDLTLDRLANEIAARTEPV